MKPVGRSISSELLSACSALNTEVTYQGPTYVKGELVYISEAEPLAKHSIEHIQSAMQITTSQLPKSICKLQMELRKLDIPMEQWERLDQLIRDIEQQF